MGKRHAPISYQIFADEIANSLNDAKLRWLQIAHSINAGNIYFGLCELATKSRFFVPVMAWRASHNQRVSATLFLGAGIPEYNTIVLIDELTIFSRQTKNFSERLPDLINDVISQVPALSKSQQTTFKYFHDIELTDVEAECAIIEMVREDIVPPSRVGQVISLWDEPADPSLSKSNSVWRLFLSVADSYKPRGETDGIGALINRSPRLMAFCKGLVVDRL